LGILHREPDESGYKHYLHQLYTGQMSKIEILGILRYSKEGKVLAVPVKGLRKAFIFHISSRVPLLGGVIALAKSIVRLPTIVRNRVSFENYCLRHHREQAQQINAFLAQIENNFFQMEERFQSLATKVEVSKIEERFQNLATKVEVSKIEEEIKRINNQLHDQKVNILDQHRRLVILLEEARKRLPEPLSKKQLEKLIDEEDHLLDAFYVSFEDKFRGTRNDIKQRTAVYLPVIQAAKAGTFEAPILDIGCGRGEWLELLHEQEFVAQGVDLNKIMIKQCQDLGFDVIESDAILYLRTLKSNSLGAVTGMHIIEHIPFKRLIALFDEVLRALKPGGVAIFETPNPENLIVGACNFYYDPTHLNPLPPEPMRFVLEARGFCPIEILRLHPYEESAMLNEGSEQLKDIVNKLMFGARDYALIAYKA
jgi:O-antigen chain-terminating methyltransferase